MTHTSLRQRRSKYSVGIFFSILIGLAVLYAESSQAQSHYGPASSAMGLSGRASVNPNESPYLNPATISHMGTYFGSVFGETRELHAPQGAREQKYGLLLTDASPENIVAGAFGVHMTQRELRNGDRLNNRDFLLALASFTSSKLSFGLSVHRLEADITPGQQKIRHSGDFGFLYTPSKTLGFGFTGHDVVAVEDDDMRRKMISTYGMGVNWFVSELFNLRADLTYPLWTQTQQTNSRMNFGLGLESDFQEFFAMRAGYNWKESEDEQYLGLGVAYKGPRLSLGYAYQVETREPTGTAHMIDLWVPFW